MVDFNGDATAQDRPSARTLIVGVVLAPFLALAVALLIRKRQREATRAERTRIAEDLHDNLGVHITEIVQLGVRHGNEDGDSKSSLVATIAQDAARALEEAVWTVSPNKETLENIVTFLGAHAEKYFASSPVRCLFDVAGQTPLAILTQEVRKNVVFSVKEAFNNVLKHSQATEVWFRIRYEGNQVVVLVEDNGKGFDYSSARSRGNGLTNLERRMTAIGGSCSFDSESRKGTSVILRFPLRN